MPTDDLDKLRSAKQKYLEERDKRLRGDGVSQFIRLEGEFARFLEDPYVKPRERSPIAEEVDVVVLGGGFGGLFTGAYLHKAGIDDFLIIDKAGDFGGTWYWNRYPGAACDVESYIYLPMLEDTGYMPVEKYARAPEIAMYSRMLGARFDLYRRSLFQTEISQLDWDEDAVRWRVATSRGDLLLARFVVIASGPLQEPKLPGIPGIERFRGHSFHTSRWDFEYTGGDALGGLTKLKDKSVGVIGTGATSIQCVPHLGQWAKQLFVFQRTPSQVDIRGNYPTDPNWFRSLPAGWQRDRSRNFTAILERTAAGEDLVDDYWTRGLFERTPKIDGSMSESEIESMAELADFATMERIRARVDEFVRDKATAAALKPWYKYGCKRPAFHDEYLLAFNRPNVKLVDTEGRGVDEVVEDGLIVAGSKYELDCLIYATGFDFAAYAGRAIAPVRGRDGLALAEKWKNGAMTLHGFATQGFPNLLMLGTTQSAWSANFPHMMEEQAIHIAYVISRTIEKGALGFEVSSEAEHQWTAFHEQYAPRVLKVRAECTPSYFTEEGHLTAKTGRNGRFGGSVFQFVEILEAWRADGNMKGIGMVFPSSPSKSEAIGEVNPEAGQLASVTRVKADV